MSDKYVDGLKTMGTRIVRGQSVESKLPIRAVFNETLDRIKRHEYNRMDKTMSSFVIKTPHPD